jgi:methionyl-tRNA formyltransferase
MKIAVIAPISTSFYSLATAHLFSQEKDIQVCAVLIRTPWSFSRLWSEWRRDGIRLAHKVVNKWLNRDESKDGGQAALFSLVKGLKLDGQDLFSLSRKNNIPIKSVSDLNSPMAESFLKNADPDLIVFTGGGLIRKNILSIPKMGVLNCHTGWLPQYRGMDVVEWALLESRAKHPQLGLSLHFMDSSLDTGPIVMQKKITLEKKDTVESIRARMQPMMVEVMLQGVRRLRDGKIKPRSQQADDGHQYYVMHPRLLAEVKKLL